MNLKQVVTANKLQQQKAKDLNLRAGENLFQIFSATELSSWLNEQLLGARNIAEIEDIEKLLLPELDGNIVKKIFQDNPDKITILGREVEIRYERYESYPVVRIDFIGEQIKDLKKIPVFGFKLPGGREIKIISAVEGITYSTEAPSSMFVKKVQEILNKQQWDSFVSSDKKPIIHVPDPSKDSEYVPKVCEYQYGICPITDEPLIAFGTITYTPKSWLSSEKFEVKWFKEREEAQIEQGRAIKVFTSKQAEFEEIALRESGNIRAISIDRRGQARKPELNGIRIDNRENYEFTPSYFWSDLSALVQEFGRGLGAFAIYRGDNPLLVYLNRQSVEKALPDVQSLIKTLGSNPTSEEKEKFWCKLEQFRTTEVIDAIKLREKTEVLKKNYPEKEPVAKSNGIGSLADAFAKFGL